MSDDQLTSVRRAAIASLDLDLACVLETRTFGPAEAGCLHPAAALRFLVGGNATFTLVNLATKARCTLRVRSPAFRPPKLRLKTWQSKPKGAWSVEEQTGQDNVRDFTLIGWLEDWNLTTLGHGRGTDTISWLTRLWRPGFTCFPSVIRFMHSGSCGRCSRQLTVPESLITGIGPECARRKAGLTKPGDPFHGLI